MYLHKILKRIKGTIPPGRKERRRIIDPLKKNQFYRQQRGREEGIGPRDIFSEVSDFM